MATIFIDAFLLCRSFRLVNCTELSSEVVPSSRTVRHTEARVKALVIVNFRVARYPLLGARDSSVGWVDCFRKGLDLRRWKLPLDSGSWEVQRSLEMPGVRNLSPP
jgi:hypothetical protein